MLVTVTLSESVLHFSKCVFLDYSFFDLYHSYGNYHLLAWGAFISVSV